MPALPEVGSAGFLVAGPVVSSRPERPEAAESRDPVGSVRVRADVRRDGASTPRRRHALRSDPDAPGPFDSALRAPLRATRGRIASSSGRKSGSEPGTRKDRPRYPLTTTTVVTARFTVRAPAFLVTTAVVPKGSLPAALAALTTWTPSRRTRKVWPSKVSPRS